ncbi:methyltransferase domain-containing protein [Candidatus Azambacteria bacterium]|nr:methyltransferase domain-containing protein [Candidatus Azambacteria bacterium]
MGDQKIEIKLAFIAGLKEVVINEIKKHPNFHIAREGLDSVYLDLIKDISEIKNLRSVSKAYIILQNPKYNPLYISNHKSILGSLIDIVINKNEDDFRSFKITCSGADSPEVRNISSYIQEKYKLTEKEDADMKIHLIKSDETWEIGVQITPRPLSLRDYKIMHMGGAMDPTIAYAMNSLCELENASSYLNIFSGSATLLIEAGRCYENLKRSVGFDNEKKHISLAMQNIQKAGLIRKIELKEKDIFDKPDLGKFDAITSDLPFGMTISKDEDLEKLYQCFIEYCEEALNDNGVLAVYTNEHEMLKKIIQNSKFKIIKTLDLKFMTSAGAYLRPKIFVCKLEN